jgi:hypothetical protein
MKRFVIHSAIAIFLLVAGLYAGMAIQHAKTGYHYKVHEEETHPSSLGDFHLKYVTETVGMGFLDSGTSMIEFDGRRLYSARRIFQEGYPVARDLKTSNDGIDWQDGEYKYHLVITKLAGKEGNPNPTSDSPR